MAGTRPGCGPCMITGLSSALGYTLFQGLWPADAVGTLPVAAGAVMAMLADTMIPEAYYDAGPLVAPATAMGVLSAFIVGRLA